MNDHIARAAYEAYTNGLGENMPAWKDLPDAHKRAWILASQMSIVVAERFGRLSPETRASLLNGAAAKHEEKEE